MGDAPADGLDERVLRDLVRLLAHWSAPHAQREIVREVGLDLDDTAIRAVYALGLRGGAARPSELADVLRLTRPTASKLLGRLVSENLVDVHDHPEDGRAKRVQLTGRGLEAYRLLRGAGVERVGGALRPWDPHERERFAQLLARFVPQVLGQDGEGAASAQRQASVAPGDRFERRTS